jgi:heme/copper-type cytochrome/quinol oxidase subunit 3
MTEYAQRTPRLEVPGNGNGAGPAARVALAPRPSAPTALWGMGILIATEATLFGAFIATYFYLRFHSVQWPPAGTPKPEWVGPVIAVALLATTSGLMQIAWRHVRAARVAPARFLLAAAFVMQAGYFAYVAHDFHAQLQAHHITESAYTSIYYTLLGADHAHVFAGLLFNLWLLAKLTRGLTTYRANATQAVTWYWHFVNVLTVVVLATVLSARI